ncbi:type II toxin-antitoxin system PemK/MazF family toxin [Pantoea sp. Al-1710]|uniref:Type II toxin-antitoxin system PemK/MazF family toxin n=1 Tax=Candidatus Pantoea communis TaxID=2608354 RepID=A0ABX0RLG5_9GAMM|nr:type II toxin-antitoxin system PemK/MazF family toxin [Pantoea sp. Cy-640]NIG17313.1 type II toxin-antitoxin system PemK/MazF family toxin [Pantoea communis]
MKRGDIVSVASNDGEFINKPRPALIIQSDNFNPFNSVVILPITGTEFKDSDIFRVELAPDEVNNLRKKSWVMIDKINTVHKHHLGEVFGQIDHAKMIEVERSLTVMLGIG